MSIKRSIVCSFSAALVGLSGAAGIAQNANLSKELNDKGCLEMMNQNYSEAEKLFSSALVEATKAHDSKRMITSLTNLSTLYEKTDRQAEAKEAASKVLAIRTKMSTPVNYRSSVAYQTPPSEPVSSPNNLTAARGSSRASSPAWPSLFPTSQSKPEGSRSNSVRNTIAQNPAPTGFSRRLKLIEFYADW